MDSADCIVIGAGVVGLAVARAMARKGREAIILEAADDFGTVTSSRNSEVIHAGISKALLIWVSTALSWTASKHTGAGSSKLPSIQKHQD
jgi:L-2-hydroxyglutarate oxidase LhgO